MAKQGGKALESFGFEAIGSSIGRRRGDGETLRTLKQRWSQGKVVLEKKLKLNVIRLSSNLITTWKSLRTKITIPGKGTRMIVIFG